MQIVAFILRIGITLTFTGHGLVAISGKQEWLGYLETIGFSEAIATYALVSIGVLDLLVAVSVLIKPNGYILLWAAIWGFATALIRPLSGESYLAFIERGANWAAPLALYFLRKNRLN